MDPKFDDEYRSLRLEIVERVKILHSLITTSIIIGLVGLVIAMLLLGNAEILSIFLLFLAMIFPLLAFNYQANQMTLEGIAKYLNTDYREHQVDKNALGWDDFYGQLKKTRRLTSFLKVLPFFLPLVIPIYLLAIGSAQTGWPLALAIIDLVLYALAIYNFRYKFEK